MTIKYKCDSCKALLETEDSLSGQTEICPLCGHRNHIPLSKEEQRRIALQHKEKLREEDKKKIDEEIIENEQLAVLKASTIEKKRNKPVILDSMAASNHDPNKNLRQFNEMPQYKSIDRLSFALMLFGYLSIVGCVIVGLFCVLALADNNPIWYIYLIVAGGLLFEGIIYLGISELLVCLKHISQNSWRTAEWTKSIAKKSNTGID